METKELKITIPEGYEIDKSKSTFEKIVFKKKDVKPISWEEYCEQCENVPCYVLCYDIYDGYWYRQQGIFNAGYCTVPSKELAEAFIAMMQLMSLRQAWIGDWRPDWKDHTQLKANILCRGTDFTIAYFKDLNSRPLSFPTKEMAEDFRNTFEDLLKIAKPLI